MTAAPVAFLCHASEDKPLAERIARSLYDAGIQTFYDEWEIRGGDSFRQKIDEGLAGCSHFIALLTPQSIKKPWVNAEIDAGFIQKVKGSTQFIPIRWGLSVADLPPLLQALHAPAIENYEHDIEQLIGDIHGVSRRPALASPPPTALRSFDGNTGLSIAAEKVAEMFIRRSTSGRSGDPEITVPELKAETSLTDEQLLDAVDELENEGLLEPSRCLGNRPFGYVHIFPTSRIFELLDPAIMGWSPNSDAVTVAARLVSEGAQRGHSSQQVMEDLGWTPRRLNPALSFLIDRDLIMASKNLDATFVTTAMFVNQSTRRFVRENS
jgi:hypothetical protein